MDDKRARGLFWVAAVEVVDEVVGIKAKSTRRLGKSGNNSTRLSERTHYGPKNEPG